MVEKTKNRKNDTLSEDFETTIEKILDKIDTPSTHIHNHPLFLLETDTAMHKCRI